jgi:hypothetical protein
MENRMRLVSDILVFIINILEVLNSKLMVNDNTLPCGQDFGYAIKAMKEGRKVCREGWNGKGMYLKMRFPNEYPGEMTHAYPYFTIPNCEEGTRRIPYASTIVDIISEDWMIVE